VRGVSDTPAGRQRGWPLPWLGACLEGASAAAGRRRRRWRPWRSRRAVGRRTPASAPCYAGS